MNAWRTTTHGLKSTCVRTNRRIDGAQIYWHAMEFGIVATPVHEFDVIGISHSRAHTRWASCIRSAYIANTIPHNWFIFLPNVASDGCFFATVVSAAATEFQCNYPHFPSYGTRNFPYHQSSISRCSWIIFDFRCTSLSAFISHRRILICYVKYRHAHAHRANWLVQMRANGTIWGSRKESHLLHYYLADGRTKILVGGFPCERETLHVSDSACLRTTICKIILFEFSGSQWGKYIRVSTCGGSG